MLSRQKQNQRAGLKKGVSQEEGRRKREENSNEIRKSKKEDTLQKRRQISSSGGGLNSMEDAHITNEIKEIYIQQVMSNDEAQQLEGVTAFRKLLSIERNPPINGVINAGVVPRLIEFLMHSPNPKIKFEAAWTITNIASGNSEQTAFIIKSGAVPVFISLLAFPDEELREQAVWALGNIAGDSAQCRDYVLQQNILPALIHLLNVGSNKASMMRNATWALSNLCRGKPHPNFEVVSPALPVLARLIQYLDAEVVIDALWALSYLSDGTDHNIETVVKAGVVPRVVELMNHANPGIQTPALRTIGNIVTGNDSQTQVAIDHGCLPILKGLLSHQKKNIKKESAWAISNITAGNKEQTNLVINAKIIPALINLMSNAEFEVKKEATWAISNATTWKSNDQIRYMVQEGVCKPLCELLGSKDSKIIQVALEAIENILSVGENNKNGENYFASVIEENEGVEKLEELQDHQNEEIYQKAVNILEKYYQAEEEVENLAPSNGAATYSFGSNLPANGQQPNFMF